MIVLELVRLSGHEGAVFTTADGEEYCLPLSGFHTDHDAAQGFTEVELRFWASKLKQEWV